MPAAEAKAVNAEGLRFAVYAMDASGGGLVRLASFNAECEALAFGVKAGEVQRALDAGRRVEVWREVWRGRWQRLERCECPAAKRF